MSTSDKHLHNPTFEWRFLLPRFWGTWCIVFISLLLAFVPFRIRDKLACKIAKLIIGKNASTLKRARLNLEQCFPEKTPEERHAMLLSSIETGIQFCLAYGELLIRSEKYKKSRDEVIGGENLFPLIERGENIISLTPHCWSIDYTGSMLASRGITITTIMRPHKSPMLDWLMHKQRMQYGRGIVYPRSASVKPFLKSVKEGCLGYYLPDEDHGPQQSAFVPFFGAEKATLKGLGKLTKLTKAKVVPFFQAYNAKSGKYELHVFPALENFPTGDETQDAIVMNQALEKMIASRPEQYMWILNILRSRPDGSKLY
ncbi:lauroyl-Kdo(2)-lipid IV(A) myristoyltransferase [Marinomonas posidonica]|uniref:Lipid A biosynthesis acyltransferase n=1 Tax=Marinomonas posidonica (strain CECT 7376 / NCIMB 14433 / IVIA-Po-181) TaxID=491952 RepID=F6CYY9_MARPP|nr:lauroyl-Kdo(2)-lipid IV(A) myristoyltransferase [Marinomonas posidonica]AEF53116.1 lipid A biosynthesis (KDO)2-(lauroyl)-lipid IVA acyltransferase [Marinomonas posidonica IVIA-Po-181]